MIALLLLALLQTVPAPPMGFIARWDSLDSATVTWSQQQRACLYAEHASGERVFVGCYENPGRYVITFGAVGPLSGDLRPMPGDVYVLTSQGVTWRAPLRWWQWIAVLRA